MRLPQLLLASQTAVQSASSTGDCLNQLALRTAAKRHTVHITGLDIVQSAQGATQQQTLTQWLGSAVPAQ